MLVMVFARNQLRSCIGEVTTASVACGVLGVGGNKGAVAVEFSVHRRKVAVVCSHFAAHQVGEGEGQVVQLRQLADMRA
jgi:phosphatidylinositol-bisphosphatase